jgi:CubicO group peptidase (beta-lactamase class C family)
MKTRRLLIAVALLVALASSAPAQGLLPAPPEAAGMSGERLARLTAVMRDYVDRGRIGGTVSLVARDGKIVYLEAAGWQDRENKVAMRPDTIFRAASMSKAATSIAIVMLMEEGKLMLGDPVSRYIPSFKETTVAVPPPPGTPGTGRFGVVPARREITLRDLLTHTAGISYGQAPSLAAERYKAAGVQGWYFADKKETIADVIDRLAKLPFDAQPGERYVYGFNTDILGVVAEKVSGLLLDEFFRTRIFEPLKMADTSFFLPPEKKGRLSVVYAAMPDGSLARAPEGAEGQGDYEDGPRMCFSGGAGLLTTASDYARMLQMLLNGGVLDGVRLLSPTSVELMTLNHAGTLYQDGAFGFGLGFEVVVDAGRAGRAGSPGSYAWGGAYHSRYFVDPREKMVGVFFSQILPARGLDLTDRFRVLAYQAVVGPPAPIPPAATVRKK